MSKRSKMLVFFPGLLLAIGGLVGIAYFTKNGWITFGMTIVIVALTLLLWWGWIGEWPKRTC